VYPGNPQALQIQNLPMRLFSEKKAAKLLGNALTFKCLERLPWRAQATVQASRQSLNRIGMIIMQKEAKVKQIVVRFDMPSYDRISAFAQMEHRGLGEFVRHATLDYIEHLDKAKDSSNDKGGIQS